MYYQGEPGAFSEAAIRHYFVEADAQGRPSFDDVFTRLADDPDAYALLPIENAYRGSVTEVWDRLVVDDSLAIWAEMVESVHLALMAKAGETLESIVKVRSHPQALMQSRGFWESRGYRADPALDTAGSAREVAEFGWEGVAAIASPIAAHHYHLNILAEPLEDYPDNRTRFWLIGQRPPHLDPHAIDTMKATVAFDIAHRPGSLFEVLKIFASRGLDLTKIESRPRPGYPFEFRFWIDVALRGRSSVELESALRELEGHVLFYRQLGVYPVWLP